MAEQFTPTKGNLIKARKFLDISNMGYDLLDRKRNILVREMLQMIEKAKIIGEEIQSAYINAYDSLQEANITLGVIDKIAGSIPIEHGISISYKSIMGIEIPKVTISSEPPSVLYGFYMTNSQLDMAYIWFGRVKGMLAAIAEIENGIYRLAVAIKKTQKRANALKNILIPNFKAAVKNISNSLEEKEREEFSRLKVIKCLKQSSAS